MRTEHLLIAALAGLLVLGGSGRVSAQVPPGDSAAARADTALLAALLRESAESVREISVGHPRRTELFRAVVGAIAESGDAPAALALLADAPEPRRGMYTGVMCRALEERDWAGARRIAEAAPDDDRDWMRAHLASQLVSPPTRRTSSSRGQPYDTAAQFRLGLATAAGIQLPEARLDALLAIGSRLLLAGDTAGAVRTLGAAAALLPEIRDADYAQSRRAILASALGRAGRLREALMHAGALASFDDRSYVAFAWLFAPGMRNDRRVGAFAEELLAEALASPDPRVRRHRVGLLAFAIRQTGDSVRAASLERKVARPSIDPTLVDRVRGLIESGQLGAALAMVDGIGDAVDPALRARAYIEIAGRVLHTNPDSATVAIDRALEAAVDLRVRPTRRDGLLLAVASHLLRLGHLDAAIDAANQIGDLHDRRLALRDIGISDVKATELDAVHGAVARVRPASVRDAVFTDLARRRVVGYRIPEERLAWARALIDSLETPAGRARLRVVLGQAHLARADTGEAVGLFRSAIDSLELGALEHDWGAGGAAGGMLAAGAVDEAAAWARRPASATERTDRLVRVARGLLRQSQRGQLAFSNGPDSCLEEF